MKDVPLGRGNLGTDRGGDCSGGDAIDLDTNLVRLFHELQAGLNGLRQIREIYDEQVAFGFNGIGFFAPSENTTSSILAFFLNPHKNHGQKAAFLRAFCEYFGIADGVQLLDKKTSVSVQTECHTPEDRRIDVVIDIGGHYVVAIENKIWAADQNRQLADYVRHLEGKMGQNYVLFYLSPYGRDPSPNSIDAARLMDLTKSKHLRIISYKVHLIELLQRFEAVCRAESVRAFIRDLREYFKFQYRNETIMDSSSYVRDVVCRSSDNMLLAFEIASSMDKVRQSVWDSSMAELRAYCNDHAIHVEVTESVSRFCAEAWAVPLRFGRLGWRMPWITLEFESRGGGGCNCVVFHAENGLSKDFLGALARKAGFKPPNAKGHIWAPIAYRDNWEDGDQPWRDMLTKKDGRGNSMFVEYLASLVQPLITHMESIAKEQGVQL